MFLGRQIFYFLMSFLATCFVGFFVWDIFINPNDSILSSQVFTGAISSNYIEVIPAASDFVPDIADEEISFEEDLADANDDEALEPVVEPESFQDQLDDIQEKLDIIAQKVQELIDEQNQKEEEEIADEEEKQDEDDKNKVDVYPKILISEVQPTWAKDDKQEFVELYNPNAEAVDLTGWYLQRKANSNSTSWSTYAGSSLFFGKTIEANGYFLIARTGYYLGLADVFTDSAITNNNSFAFKNPNKEISDKLGFGQAADPEAAPAQNPSEGQSIGRKINNGIEQDFNVNSIDFELQMPTPKAQNVTYVFPPNPAVGGGGGGSTSTDYPKILISEVQIYPIEERFVELFNPNSTDVDLTGWYLQRKTSDRYNSFVSSPKFAGKIILANGYFLISRSNDTADITLSDLTLSPNNFLAIKSPDEKISDEISFGAVEDNRSIGRKVLADGGEQDTDDSSVDFEIDTPTPRAQNIAYVEPPPPELTDTIPPEVSFNLEPIQTELTFSINFIVTDLAELVSPSGVAGYIFRWQEDGDSDWQTDAPIFVDECLASVNLARDFEGEDGKTYNFQVQTTDCNGNESVFSPDPPIGTTIESEPAEDTTSPSVLSYTLQVSGQDSTEENNVVINSDNGVKIQVSVDEPCKFEVWINGKKYWYTTTFTTSISRPSSGCSYWSGTQNSCSGDVLPDGVYPIDLKITDEAGNEISDASKTITIDNSQETN